MAQRCLSVRIERWPIAGTFAISRGGKADATVVTVEVTDGSHRGRGEAVPYARYGESAEAVAQAIEAKADQPDLDLDTLQHALPAGAARNALDCALWDLAAKRARRPVHELLRLPSPKPLMTAYTISLASPEQMADAAAIAAARPLLKIKLGGVGDAERIAAVRHAAPRCELIVDANEGWKSENLAENFEACAQAGVTLIEQPLPADDDEVLAFIPHPIAICADESAHTRGSLPALKRKYDVVNIKLDKAGGLTEALAMAQEAQKRFQVDRVLLKPFRVHDLLSAVNEMLAKSPRGAPPPGAGGSAGAS